MDGGDNDTSCPGLVGNQGEDRYVFLILLVSLVAADDAWLVGA